MNAADRAELLKKYGMRVEFEGRTWTMLEPGDYLEMLAKASPSEREVLIRAVNEGILTDGSGRPVPHALGERVRARMLGTYADMQTTEWYGDQQRRHEAEGGTPWLIPGLWPWGTTPSLGGNPGAGKTVVVCDLLATLLVPGRSFLGRERWKATWGGNDPADSAIPSDVRVWLVNTEMARGPMLDALDTAGLREDSRLKVVHIDDHGGPEAFDLTDPAAFNLWAEHFTRPSEPGALGPFAEEPPDLIVVDNLTAILQAVERSLERTGELIGAFLRLQHLVSCPNGLVVLHNTQEGGHAMGSVTASNRQAGRWSYWSSNWDDPNSARYFKVVPRDPGEAVPKTPVVKDENGRPLIAGEPVAATGDDERPTARADVLRVLDEAGAKGLRRTEVTGSGGAAYPRRDALRELVESGEVIERPMAGRGNPVRCWLARHA